MAQSASSGPALCIHGTAAGNNGDRGRRGVVVVMTPAAE